MKATSSSHWAFASGCGNWPATRRLKDSTLVQYLGDLERWLDRLLAGDAPDKPAARRLFRAMRPDRDDLFRFITRRDVPRTNNACERAPRPSVIFRKVTSGFRAE
jgi:transposase